MECLTSYVSRLAAAHCLSPAVLLGRTLAPLMGKNYWLQGGARPGTRGSALGNSFSTHAKAVNGTGVIAKDWVRVIEGLTMRNDLRFLTMLPWANALTCRHLLRPTRAWCPSCYGERRANEQIVYEPLLWAFSEVQVCLRHQRRLRFQCHHCARYLPWLGRRTLPGHCSKCGEWLGMDLSAHSTDVAPADDELAWQTWVVKNLEEMIVAATHLPSSPRERIAKALSLCIDQVTDGIMNRFACLIGKRKNTVWGWQHGKAKIPMGDLLRICDRVGVSLVDFLYAEFVTQNEVELIPTRFPFSGVTTTRRRPRPFDRETTERALRTALKDHPPVPMKEVARKLNTDKRSLYKHFPSLCRAISARHAKDRQDYYETLRSQSEKDIRHVRGKLRASGIYPSRRRVAALITKPTGFRDSSSGKLFPVRDLQN